MDSVYDDDDDDESNDNNNDNDDDDNDNKGHNNEDNHATIINHSPGSLVTKRTNEDNIGIDVLVGCQQSRQTFGTYAITWQVSIAEYNNEVFVGVLVSYCLYGELRRLQRVVSADTKLGMSV